MSTIPGYPAPLRPLSGEEPLAAWQDGRQIALPVSFLIEGVDKAAAVEADRAQRQADRAAAQVGLAENAAAATAVDRVQVAQDRASTGADVATTGAYRTAVLQAAGSIPANTALTLQTPTLALLAAVPLANLAGGSQAQVTEKLHAGVFEWLPGNQAPLLAGAPAGQSMVVAPTAAPSGGSGVWQRRGYGGSARATWAGVAASGLSQTGGVANHARLNWLLGVADVRALLLQAGVTGISANIGVPDGKTLEGEGEYVSILKAVDWAFTGNGGEAFATSHFMVTAGTGSRVLDLWVDGDKFGAKQIVVEADNNRRLNGVNAQGAVDFLGERLRVTNITGYGRLLTGARNSHFRYGSSENVQVHCEATNASADCSFRFIAASGGDGDIACEAPFHALNGSQRIDFADSSYKGDAGSGLLVIGNEPNGLATTAIRAINLEIELTGATTCITANNSFANVPCEVEVIGGRYRSKGAAIAATNVKLHLKGDADIAAADTGISGDNAVVRLTGATLRLGEGLPTDGYAAFWNFGPNTHVTIDGGRLVGKPDGKNSIGCPFKGAITVLGQPNLADCPTLGDVNEQLLLGKGHRVTRELKTEVTAAEMYAGWLDLGGALGFKMTPGCRYRVTVTGQASSTGNTGFVIMQQVAGAACMLFGGEAFVQATPTDRAPTWALIDASSDYYVDGNRAIATASNPAKLQQFGFSYMVTCNADSSSSIRTLAAARGGDGFGQYAVNNSNAGPVTVHAGTTMMVEQIA